MTDIDELIELHNACADNAKGADCRFHRLTAEAITTLQAKGSRQLEIYHNQRESMDRQCDELDALEAKVAELEAENECHILARKKDKRLIKKLISDRCRRGLRKS